MIVTLGHTANFKIRYEKSLTDGLRRAKALKSSCEADFAKLRTWFTATGGFGTKNRMTLVVKSMNGGDNNRSDRRRHPGAHERY